MSEPNHAASKDIRAESAGSIIYLLVSTLTAALADVGVAPLREGLDELVRVREHGRGLDFLQRWLVGSSFETEHYVPGNRPRVERRLLRDDSDVLCQPRGAELKDLIAVDGDSPALLLVEMLN